MLKTTFAIAAIGFASIASAGTLVAPGPASSVTGAIVALPGVSRAIAEVSGTDMSGPIVLPSALNPTQIQNIANAYNVPYEQGTPLTLQKVRIRLASGEEIEVNLTIDAAGKATLTPA